MVSSGVNRREAVDTSGETVRDVSGNNAVLRGAVNALEESEAGRVGRSGLVERSQLLDDNVRVADDIALTVNSAIT